MLYYQFGNGTAIDLEHLQVVGPLRTDYGYTDPHLFHLTLAFGSSKVIAFDTEEQAEFERNLLLSHWRTSNPKMQVFIPVERA